MNGTETKRGLTWADAQAYVGWRYELADARDDGFDLVWEFEVEGLGSVQQHVSAQLCEGYGEAWIELSADIDTTLSPREALELTGDNLIGSIGIDRSGAMVVRHTAPLASLTRADLERLLEWVGREAAALSRPALPPAAQDDVNALFCTAL